MGKDCTKIMRLFQDYQTLQQEEAKEEDQTEGLKLMYAIADKIGLKDMVKDKVKEAVKEKVVETFLKKGASRFVIPGVLKKAAVVISAPVGIIIDIASDPEEGNPLGSERYYKYMKNILHEFYSGGNKAIIRKNYELLLDAQQQLVIEKDFGINSNCYGTIKGLTEEIRKRYVDGSDQLKQG